MEALFFFVIQTSNRMQFFPSLQDKLHSLNIQDDRSARFLPQQIIELTTFKIILSCHVIKRFHKENSRMSGLFGQNTLLLCGIQDNTGL